MSKARSVSAVAFLLALVLGISAASALGAERMPGCYPAGKVIEHVKMKSDILGKDIQYTVYLPPDYATSERSYPIFYLLHGSGDRDHGWVHLGEMNHIMDKGIAEGTITPMVVIMPDGQRDPSMNPRTYYMNDADGGYKWADMFLKEMIPHVEQKYRVRPERRTRGIGGLSMGGYGSLMFAFQNPDMFSCVVGLSAALYDRDQILGWSQGNYDQRYGKGFGGTGLEGEARITELFWKNHPLGLMHKMDVKDLKKQRIFLDCGAEDRLAPGNFELHMFLIKAGIPHVFTMRTGDHVWQYWREGLPKGMEFASSVFHE